MSEKVIENNKVSVIGEIISGFTFSHEVFGEGFYMVDVAMNRDMITLLSGFVVLVHSRMPDKTHWF